MQRKPFQWNSGKSEFQTKGRKNKKTTTVAFLKAEATEQPPKALAAYSTHSVMLETSLILDLNLDTISEFPCIFFLVRQESSDHYWEDLLITSSPASIYVS